MVASLQTAKQFLGWLPSSALTQAARQVAGLAAKY